MSDNLERVKIIVQGTVQAVGFRPFIYRLGEELNLSGRVKNLGDAGIEIILEGKTNDIQEFIDRVREENPPLSEIQSMNVEYQEAKGLEKFQISNSEQRGESGGGTIPPDAAICDECLEDMRNPDSRYYKYWSTSCVNCGPRFTIIRSLPYDRPRTSMEEFPMCKECESEYSDPKDRRYHAQTIACPECGPKLYSHPKSDDPISKGAETLKENGIVAIKGLGGTHIACNAYDSDAVVKLKEKLGRPHQPLALMAEDLGMINKFAKFSEKEKKSLKSIKRPIIILDKKKNSDLSPEVSEGLHTVGVMLPYTGLHYLLFEHLDFPIVMTSANMPGEPMLVKNEKIVSELKEVTDFTILHEREIVARCDDSVVRFPGNERRFLRRSRGWAPSPIGVKIEGEPTLALGAELDNTISLFDGENCYVSQYIGDVDNVKTLEFLKETIDHLVNITGTKVPQKIACDLHPDFLTTHLAEEMSENPIRVQHHHAHLAGILAENGLENAIGIAADGVGYGSDGNIWGGEVMKVTKGKFEREGHLSEMIMPGGDRATKYPSRMIGGILHQSPDLLNILEKHGKFQRGEEERKIVAKQIKNKINSPITTSSGRFLDAVASLLDICHERSYEGEPAMKLESFSRKGTNLGIKPEITKINGKLVLDMQNLMRRLIDLKEKGESKRDIGATAEDCLAEGLTTIATSRAENYGIENVCFTGGVAYNERISKKIRTEVEESNMNLLVNKETPCGDGGASFGQTVVASNRDG